MENQENCTYFDLLLLLLHVMVEHYYFATFYFQLCTALGLAVAGGSAILYALEQSVKAYDWPVHPPNYPWYHHGILNSYDHARYF